MAVLDVKDKEKIWDFVSKNFMAMPLWLRSSLIVALCVGVFYISYVRPNIVFQQEKQKTEQIFHKIESMNQKIAKIEEIRIANEDMIYNIEEVRGIVEYLSELHHNETEILIRHVRPMITSDEYRNLINEIDECDNEYRKHVNEMFEKKSKKHLRETTEIVK